MLLKFQTAPLIEDQRSDTKRDARRVPRSKLVARPVKDPDYAELRKKIEAKFSKTLAYLAK